ncbi:MAG TPA: hypothetical protein VEG60_05375 [Candidatus Binatia bacterium]|nr:hypothetical protein [Candidatus Binatia bacterium]
MNQPSPKKNLEELRERRRRERWNAFWTPFLTMASVVTSVAMLMFLVKTCQERNLPAPILPPTSPLTRPGAANAPIEHQPAGSDKAPATTPDTTTPGRAERLPAK